LLSRRGRPPRGAPAGRGRATASGTVGSATRSP
jgi:hypothetical protein